MTTKWIIAFADNAIIKIVDGSPEGYRVDLSAFDPAVFYHIEWDVDLSKGVIQYNNKDATPETFRANEKITEFDGLPPFIAMWEAAREAAQPKPPPPPPPELIVRQSYAASVKREMGRRLDRGDTVGAMKVMSTGKRYLK